MKYLQKEHECLLFSFTTLSFPLCVVQSVLHKHDRRQQEGEQGEINRQKRVKMTRKGLIHCNYTTSLALRHPMIPQLQDPPIHLREQRQTARSEQRGAVRSEKHKV